MLIGVLMLFIQLVLGVTLGLALLRFVLRYWKLTVVIVAIVAVLDIIILLQIIL